MLPRHPPYGLYEQGEVLGGKGRGGIGARLRLGVPRERQLDLMRVRVGCLACVYGDDEPKETKDNKKGCVWRIERLRR